MRYFSERELGERPREIREISGAARAGIIAEICVCAQNGSFGAKYAQLCDDGPVVVGTDYDLLFDAMRAELPGLAVHPERDQFGYRQTVLDDLDRRDSSPPASDILDLIEFCWQHVGKPRKLDYHSYYQHSHLAFDQDAGREQFREKIETIFRRNGLAYTLTEDGSVERRPPPDFERILVGPNFTTGDAKLDHLLSTARGKFLDPHPERRQEALESLWDGWERLKTIDDPGSDKKAQTAAMLDAAAGGDSPKFRDALEREAKELTGIGNSLGIRHSETNQESLAHAEHADYLFYRLFSLIWLILQRRQATDVPNDPQGAHRSRPAAPA